MDLQDSCRVGVVQLDMGILWLQDGRPTHRSFGGPQIDLFA
jgi:hypothetical protein